MKTPKGNFAFGGFDPVNRTIFLYTFLREAVYSFFFLKKNTESVPGQPQPVLPRPGGGLLPLRELRPGLRRRPQGRAGHAGGGLEHGVRHQEGLHRQVI